MAGTSLLPFGTCGTADRPPSLATLPTSRYRDNYFVALTAATASLNYQSVAAELTALLAMPVKFEQAGTEVRCLELRLRFPPGQTGARDGGLPHRSGPPR